jgi:hypothetical protein
MAIFYCKVLAMASGKAERGKTYEKAHDSRIEGVMGD